jgi:hypothetical protein
MKNSNATQLKRPSAQSEPMPEIFRERIMQIS